MFSSLFLTPSSNTYSESCEGFLPPAACVHHLQLTEQGDKLIPPGSDCFSGDKLRSTLTLSLVLLTSQFNPEIWYSASNNRKLKKPAF